MSSYENLSPQVITRIAREIQDLARKPAPGTCVPWLLSVGRPAGVCGLFHDLALGLGLGLQARPPWPDTGTDRNHSIAN